MAVTTLDAIALTESLGSGSCGEVFAVEDNSEFVVKRYRSMAIDRRFLARNSGRMESMPDCDGIVAIHDHRFDPAPYEVLMDRVAGSPLSSCRGMKEPVAWTVIRSIAKALGHAHKFGVFHGHLHPANVLMVRNAGESKPLLTDFGSGLVGEVHHIELGDSTFFAAPEQLLCSGEDWEDGALQKWDVYSFGVIAFWLVCERLPRGIKYLKHRDKEISQSGGRPVPIDVPAFLTDVFDTPEIPWGKSLGLSREHKLYREIIDDCLHLDPAKRPVDLREVRNRFRALDQQFALENAEDRVVKEKRKQKAKLFGARAIAAGLGLSFLGATYFLVEYLRKTYFYQNKVTELDQVVHTQKAHITHLDEQWSETMTDLKTSREVADDFFQRMAQGDDAGGSGVATLKMEELEKSREYYVKILSDIGSDDSNKLERARARHSLAHIERKMGLTDIAFAHFRETIDTFEVILEGGISDESRLFDINRRIADSYENVSALLENPIGAQALASLQKAVEHFNAVIELKPNDVEYVTRQAGTNYRLGNAYYAHRKFPEAIAAYSQSAELASGLREHSPDSHALTELVGKLQFRAAMTLGEAGRIDESIDAHVAAMETLEELRGVNGFSPLQSVQMASSFVELGDLFARRDAENGDLDQLYNESLRLLTPLQTVDPGDVEVAILLCRSLTRLGEIERSTGQWSSGYRLSVRGIESLKTALGEQPDHVEGILVLAESRIDLLKFLENEKTAAINLANRGLESVEQAAGMLGEGSQIEEPLHSRLQQRLVSIFQTYGDVCKELGETISAKKCYEQAAFIVSSIDFEQDLIIR